MERGGRNTTAGVLCWTPAPQRPSPSSSLGSEVDWGDEEVEDEEGGDRKDEEEEDFQSQVDENGIIGLDEAWDDVGLVGEEEEEGGAEEDPPRYSDAWNPEGPREGSLAPSRTAGLMKWLEQVNRVEELQLCDLQDSEPLSRCESNGEDTQTKKLCEDVLDANASVEIWGEDVEQQDEKEQSWPVHNQQEEHLPERDRQLDITEDERELEDEESEPHLDRTSASTAGTGWDRGHSVKGEESQEEVSAYLNPEKTSELSEGDTRGGTWLVEGVSDKLSTHYSPDLRPPPLSPSSTSRGSTFPHLVHFSSEELADAPGIQAETFPEDSIFTESPPESRSSRISEAPRLFWGGEELTPRTSTYPVAISPERRKIQRLEMGEEGSQDGSDHQPLPSLRAIRPSSPSTPGAMSHSPQTDCHAPSQARTHRESSPKPQHRSHDGDPRQGRRWPLTHPTPDFSKVQPKVRFPKSGYTPPKSKGSPRTFSFSGEPPLVFKSPADIVREVLLSSSDRPPPPSVGPGRPLNTTVPGDFRCPQQASMLVQQLQEDYSRLLTRYAEAENTIDRMRLEAKVGLYSDPPKPAPAIQLGVLRESSKVMTLTFPQAQRAELSSGSLNLNGQVTRQGHIGVSPLRPSSVDSSVDSSSADSFSRSMGCGGGEQLTMTLSKQAGRFLQQVQTFEELLSRGKPKQLEFTKGLSQLLQEQDSLERGYLAARDQHRLLQQRGAKLGPFDPDREVEGCIFQCGMRLEELREQVEQSEQAPPPPHPAPYSMPAGASEHIPLPQSPVRPLPGESGGVVEVEVSSASGESEGDEEALSSFLLHPLHTKHTRVERDFSMLMNHCQRAREPPRLLDLVVTTHPGGEGTTGGPHQGPGRQEGHTTQRWPMLSQQNASLIPTARPRTSKSVPPSLKDLSQSPAFAAMPANDNRSEVRRSLGSSLTSLEDSALSERRGSKWMPRTRKEPSQDGVITPETDSGFVGSESSHLTPAVASPLHQRATVSQSVTEEQSSAKPQHTASIRPPTHTPQRPLSLEHSGVSRRSSSSQRVWRSSGRTTGRERRANSASSRTPRPWAGNGTIQPVSGEDEERRDCTTRTARPQHQYQSSPSPTAPYHHGDPQQAQSSSLLTNRNEAIQSLQAEVSRLKERLEGSLRQTNTPSPVRAPPTGQDGHTHPLSSTPHVRSVQRTRVDAGEERTMGEKTEGQRVQRSPKKSVLSSRPQKPELDIMTDSERAQSTPRPWSRRIPVSPAACAGLRQSRTEKTKSGSMSIGGGGVCDAGGRGWCPQCSPLCSQCFTQTHGQGPHHGQSERPEEGGSGTGPHHCPMCGRSEASPERDQRTANRRSQPMSSPDRDKRGVLLAGHPPPVMGSVPFVKCVPVCPPVLFYTSPVKASPSHPPLVYVPLIGGVASGVRGRKVRSGSVRSLSADQKSLSSSLNQAIHAAREVREASRRVARSVATGLHQQEARSQSCMY
ncbi:microtubule organization protein AKNA isoform X2 [Esox lucius]|uniref:microtubule organization protein AKNA isoform X2 n=1 Tax=Esox lucius TaxID=8010 RepID=UPI0014770A34|nr:microtubule organization protein AKNA isoform X2 [Esox lucius]